MTKRQLGALGAALLLASVCFGQVASLVYLEDNGGPALQATTIWNKSGTQFFVQGTGASPWHIYEWGNPNDLYVGHGPSDGSCSSPPLWSLANSTTRVCWMPGGNKVELAQSGQDVSHLLPCIDPIAPDPSVSAEYDLFIQQNNLNSPNSSTLDSLVSLKHAFGLRIIYVNITQRCGTVSTPWFDQFAVLTSVVLSSSTGQTLFYQLMLKSSNLTSPDHCQDASFWFYGPQPGNSSVYGVNDSLGAAYGLACPSAGGARSGFNLDLLPRLKALIQAGPAGADQLDHDISHWKLSGWYMGQLGYGGFVGTTLWDTIELTAELPKRSRMQLTSQ